MPRIRSIKPEALQHRKVGALSDGGFRVWVAFLTQADDEGRVPAEAAQVRVWAFAYHPRVTEKAVEHWIQEVAATGLIRLYHVDGTRYAVFPSWHDHQKINRPTASRLPEPPALEHSLSPHGGLTEDSRSTHAGSDRIGSEGNEIGGERAADAAREAGASPDAAREVLNYLNRKAGRNFRATDVNLTLIRARLKDGITAEQLKAIVSRKVREWGSDEKMAKYLRPATLFNREKAEQYVGELGGAQARDPASELPERRPSKPLGHKEAGNGDGAWCWVTPSERRMSPQEYAREGRRYGYSETVLAECVGLTLEEFRALEAER